jgi:short-subunit dehydrogenase
MNLQDRRVLITGASGGIGRALVAALLQEGAHVLLSGRDREALSKVVEESASHRERTALFSADLTNDSDRARLCEFASRWRGGIDVLINNAAVSDFALLPSVDPGSLDVAIATNLVAPIDLCRRLVSRLERSEDAHIVNIGSVFGNIGFAGNSVYCATKFGLRGFSEALRRELADTSIRVHYFAPRATRTAFNSDLVDEMNQTLGNASDDPVEVARCLVQALREDQLECVIGRPEKFFTLLNALLPRLVDAALRKKLATIRNFASRSTSAARSTAAFAHTSAKPRKIV